MPIDDGAYIRRYPSDRVLLRCKRATLEFLAKCLSGLRGNHGDLLLSGVNVPVTASLNMHGGKGERGTPQVALNEGNQLRRVFSAACTTNYCFEIRIEGFKSRFFQNLGIHRPQTTLNGLEVSLIL
jgi:hypothetical protein